MRKNCAVFPLKSVLKPKGETSMDIARDAMECFFADFGSRKKQVSFLSRVPQKRKAYMGKSWAW